MRSLLLPLLPLLLAVSGGELSFHKNSFEGSLGHVEWVGTDPHSVLALVGGSPYLSFDRGETFKPLDVQGSNITRLTLHPARNTHWLLSGPTASKVWVSTDMSKNFEGKEIPEALSGFVFHPEHAELIAGYKDLETCDDQLTCPRKVYVSSDLGDSWELAFERAKGFHWYAPDSDTLLGLIPNPPRNPEYYAPSEESWGIARFHLKSKELEMVLEDVDHFETLAHFVFALQRFEFNRFFYTTIPKSDRFSSFLMVNSDLLNSTVFTKTNLHSPQLNLFHILDAENGVSIVDVPTDQSVLLGTVYHSDARGARFVSSIPNVMLYREVVDYVPVHSLPSTFVALHYNGNNMVSKVTWSGGSEWSEARTDEGQELSLFGFFKDSFYGGHAAIYSEKNAPGAIVANGVIGLNFKEYLDGSKKGDVYYSRDAGSTFAKVLDGDHTCQFLNEGSILICLPAGLTDTFKYSLDQGATWVSKKFTEEKIETKALDSENGFGMSALIIGEKGSNTLFYSVNLGELGFPNCKDSDYEFWKPSGSRQKETCILGRELTYSRPKTPSACKSARNQIVMEEALCKCKREDYECDVDFSIDASTGECTLDPGAPLIPLTVCSEGSYLVPSGYRLIGGDQCDQEKQGSLRLGSPVESPCQDKGGEGSGSGIKVSMTLLLLITVGGLAAVGGVYLWRRKARYNRYRSVQRDVPME